jgi:glycosyltransferase involved in cell wall biosynthesis
MDPSAKQKRIAFVIAHLGSGGAQRVVATAANALVERGLDVHLITILDDHADIFSLDPRIKRHRRSYKSFRRPLDREVDASEDQKKQPTPDVVSVATWRSALGRVLGAAVFALDLARRTRWLKGRLRQIQPNAVLSFLTQTNILTVLATRGLPVRTVLSERNDPLLQRNRRRVELLRRLVYRRADLVTANTHGALSALEPFVPKQKLAYLPNLLKLDESRDFATFGAPTFITVGRLVEQKGLDILLKASASAFAQLPRWQLAIVGDGPLRVDLQALARSLRIAERIVWCGYVGDPIRLMRGAKFFVLTSRFEGSPNALLEAMACGLPAIVTDASPGPLELIGETAGLVVPVGNVTATAAAIRTLASDEPLRARMGRVARTRAQGQAVDVAIETWLDLLRCS